MDPKNIPSVSQHGNGASASAADCCMAESGSDMAAVVLVFGRFSRGSCSLCGGYVSSPVSVANHGQHRRRVVGDDRKRVGGNYLNITVYGTLV